jgi:TP901 family phage tail tape measure protein
MSGDTTSRVIWFKTDVDSSGIKEASKEINKFLVALSKDVADQMQKIQSSVNNAITPINSLTGTMFGGVKEGASEASVEINKFNESVKESFSGISKDIEKINKAIRQADMSKWEKAADDYRVKIEAAQKTLENLTKQSEKLTLSDEEQEKVNKRLEKIKEKINKLQEAKTGIDNLIQQQKEAERLAQIEKERLEQQKKADAEAAANKRKLDNEAAANKRKLDNEADKAAKAAAKEQLKAVEDYKTKLGNAFDAISKETESIVKSVRQINMTPAQKTADNYAESLRKSREVIDELIKKANQLNLTAQQRIEIDNKIAAAEQRLLDLQNAQQQSMSKMSGSNLTKGMSESFGEVTDRARQFKYEIMDIGRMFVMMAASIAAAIGVPVKAFGDFQKEMLTLKNLASDFTSGELKQFEESAKAIASANGIMATEIAKSGIELVRLGLSAQETNLVLGQVADAALANSISIVKAAEIGLGTTKAMGLEVKDLSKVLDMMTRTAVTSATDIEGLGVTFKYAAPIFRSAGQDMKQLGIATGILANNMVRNSQAGTTLRSMLTNLQKPSKEARELLNKLNIQIIDQNTLGMKPFMKIIQELSASMKGMSVETKNAALATIFGKYALSGASALVNSTTEQVDKMTAAMDNNALSNKKMADGMREGINFQLDQLKANLGNAAIEMGEAFAPAVSEMVKSVADFAKQLSELPDDIKTSTAEFVISTSKIALWSAGIASSALAINSLYRAIKDMIPLLTGAFTAGVAAAVGGLTWLISQSKNLVGAFTAAGGGAAGLGAILKGGLKESIAPIINLFKSLRTWLTGTASTMGLVGASAGTLTVAIGTLLGGVAAIVGVIITFKELWELTKASVAEEQAWNKALDSVNILNKRMKESNRQAEILIKNMNKMKGIKPGEEFTVAPEKPQTEAEARTSITSLQKRVEELQSELNLYTEKDIQKRIDYQKKILPTEAPIMKRAIEKSLKKEIELLQAMQTLAQAKQSQDARKLMDEAKTLIAKYKTSLATVKDPQNEREKALKQQIEKKLQEQLKVHQDNFNILKKMNLLSQDELITRSTENIELEKSLKESIEGKTQKKENTEEQKRQNELQKRQTKFLEDLQRDTERRIQQRRQQMLSESTPTPFTQTGRFGEPRKGHLHSGIDYAAPMGTPFVSPYAGRVVSSGEQSGYGKTLDVIFENLPGVVVKLAHASELLVGAGQSFAAGTKLFKVGSSGYSTGPHAHVETRVNGVPVDPNKYSQITGLFTGRQIKAGQKDIAAEEYARTAAILKQELSKTTDQALRDNLIKAIEQYENKATDAVNDAEQKRLEARQEAMRQMQEMLQQNENEILSIELDLAGKRAAIENRSLEHSLRVLEENSAAEEEKLFEKFGQYEELDQLLESLDEKHYKKRKQIVQENEMRLTEIVKQQSHERAKETMSSGQKTIYDLQQQMLQLNKELNAVPAGQDFEQTRQQLQLIIAELQRRISVSTILLEYDQILSDQDDKRYNQQQELLKLQNLLDVGLISQNRLNSEKVSINKQIIDDAEEELVYLKEILKEFLTEEEYKNKVRAATEKLNKAKQDNLEIDKESLAVSLRKIIADKQSGKIGQEEALQKSIDAYNSALDKMNVTDDNYNSTLAARNELMLKSAVISQDFTKILEAQIRNLYGVEQASQATIFSFGDMKLNGEQLIKALPDLSDAFSKLGSSVSKGNDALGKAINAIGAIASVTMKLASGNPALMIAGIVEAIAFMTDVFTELVPTQEQVDERNLELARSLAEVEQKARDAATQIAYLRGEISKYDKESRDRESQRKKMGDDLTNLQKEESNLANNLENIQKGYFGGLDLSQNALGSILSAFASKDVEEKLKNVRKQITELTSDIQVFDAETEKISQKSPIEQAIAGNEEYIKQLELNAQATFSLYDDAVAAEMKKISDLASAHQTELENAIDNGLNIEEVQQRHNQEMKNLMDENLRNRQKAIEDEKQMLLDAQIELQQVLAKGTGTKTDDILLQSYIDKSEIINKLNERLMEVKPDTPQALIDAWVNIAKSMIGQIDKNALNDIAANEREKQKFNRETTMLEIENSEDSYKIFRQSIEDKMADLDDWKAAQIAAGEDANDIERRYQAQRIEIQRKAADDAKQFATQQMSELKNIRKEILDTQSLRYEQEILQQERFLLDLNKQRDDLQRQIDWYDNQIAKLKGAFNEADKGMFQNLLANVDIPAEVRKGLELIANPTDVPNNRFSRDSQRKAIQEQVEMLTLANKNLLDLEERSTVDYWKEESRIALIQGAAANEMLTDTTIATKLTAKEKLEIQKDLADAYKRFQEAEIRMIEEKYQAEKNAADKQLLDMKIKEADRNTIIANNKYQLDLLKQKYDQDINTIDRAVSKLNDSHKGLVFSLSEVERKLGNMNPIIEKITSSYKNLSSTINSIGSSSGTGISGTSVNTSTYSPYQTSTHTVQGNKGWYTNTSDMIAAESLGLKDGGIIGMIPNQDKYKGDKFPIMPGVNGNAGELLVSPLERLSEIMPTSNNFSVMVTGNVFKDDVDFERVMKSVFKEQNLRSNMSSGQFYSNLRR